MTVYPLPSGRSSIALPGGFFVFSSRLFLIADLIFPCHGDTVLKQSRTHESYRTDPLSGTGVRSCIFEGEKHMKEPNTIWKCAECGIVFEALQPCEKGDECIPACCGRGMTRMMENRSDGAGEKHVPVAAAHGDQLKVTVGTVAHPMLEAHFIQWIEVVDGDMVYRKYLKPGDAPEAVFPVKYRSGLILREYCNLHGLWAFTIP